MRALLDRRSAPGFVIVGGGPVALACALWCAREGSVKVLMLRDPRADQALGRVEVVPIHVIAALVELGIHPHALGVTAPIQGRLAAWSTSDPQLEPSPPAAHVERPALELALLSQCLRLREIELCVTDTVSARGEALSRSRLGSVVIDASGRDAAMATWRMRPPRPWVARFFHVSTGPARSVAPFMIAALPQGYAYRAAGQTACTVGIVGRGAWLRGTAAEIRERLGRNDARWLVQDLVALPWTALGAKAASTQWAASDAAASIGDAGFARDALSSQGLASGLKEARYASLVRTSAHRADLARRSVLARVAHSGTLAHMISACRWHAEPLWRDYRHFLEQNVREVEVDDNAFLNPNVERGSASRRQNALAS